ncbi:MAG: hypothetical protein CMK02_05710 [Polycyclovorans sp.]|nr:hypothetical protein [Polycyclovorans sp.]|tara:strand:- start:9652 stop:10482 length:831 start_codon:yes stop_codon:yes gene_type:complete
MIISDRHHFVFAHIPKCAGTSVRNALQHLDDRDGFYTGRVDQHPTLGLLDYVHIPLFTLRDHFRSEFEKAGDYWSFAVVRDPFGRFPSSVSQRFKMYGAGAIQNQTTEKIKAEIEHSIKFLLRQPRHQYQLPAEYIHFQKQVDYVYLDGVQIVDSLYLVDEVDRLLQDVSARTELDSLVREGGSEPRLANRSMVYRNEALRRLVEITRPFARIIYRAVPKSAQQRLQSMIYVPRNSRLESLFSSEYVTDFIKDYYREDLALFDDVREARIKKRAAG